MMGMTSLILSYFSGRNKVRLADGALISVYRKFYISYRFLSSALHLPKFAINMLSISYTTKELNCSVTFFPTHFPFLGLGSKLDDWQ